MALGFSSRNQWNKTCSQFPHKVSSWFFFFGGGYAQNCLRPSYYKEKIPYDKMDSKIKLLHVIIGLINKGKKATNGRAIFFLRLYVACKSCGSLEPFKTFQNCKKLFLSYIAQALQWMPKDLNEVCSPTASSRSSHECLLVNYCSQLTFFLKQTRADNQAIRNSAFKNRPSQKDAIGY